MTGKTFGMQTGEAGVLFEQIVFQYPKYGSGRKLIND
jgi:hypothetical protein